VRGGLVFHRFRISLQLTAGPCLFTNDKSRGRAGLSSAVDNIFAICTAFESLLIDALK
jgi:hypothetical protein